MCPVCLTTAVVLAGSITSTGGLAAIARKRFGVKKNAANHPVPTSTKEDRHDGARFKVNGWAVEVILLAR